MGASTPASTTATTGDQTMDYINAVQNQDTQPGYEKKAEKEWHDKQMEIIAPEGGYKDVLDYFK